MIRRTLCAAAAALATVVVLVGQGTWTNPALSENKEEQFGFWVGEWDVNLRIRQNDLSWKDSIRAHTKIFSILDGHAVLELWDSTPIVGYSLRYYDSAKGKWVLWLNWPSKDQSGSGSLEGEFRHGRGEFSNTRKNAQGGETISRYTFADVSPISLRWDDAYSSDGGKTWTHRWIMEFSRTAPKPTLPTEGDTAHTFDGGQRCSPEEFRRYESLAGQWRGDMRSEEFSSAPLSGHGYRVLGGCALIFLRTAASGHKKVETFGHLTYNTRADTYELTLIDNQGSPARVFYGSYADGVLDLKHAPQRGAPATHRYVIALPTSEGLLSERLLEADPQGEWTEKAAWSMKPQPQG